MKTRRTLQTVIAALFVLSLAPLTPATDTHAQATSRTFPETGKTVRGPFLRYWESHGGLAQQGYPISSEMQERSPVDGKTYTVQYFERAVFEMHPELAGTPHEVLLSLLGVWQYGTLYGQAGATGQRPNTGAGSILFPQTGKRVGGVFLDYWQRNGGLAQQGYPISDEITELSAMDGKPYTVQYFERAVFERHADRAGTPHEVMLSQLGRYRHNVVHASPQLPAPQGNRAQLNLVASDLFLAWREVEAGDTNPDPEYRPTYHLRAMDLRTGRSFLITTTYNEFSKPAISGSLIAWASENLQCPECDMDIYARDLATGETTLVATGPAIQHAAAVSGRTVVWIEQEENGRDQVGITVLGSTAQQFLWGSQRGSQGAYVGYLDQLALNDEFVVWTRFVEGISPPNSTLFALHRKSAPQVLQTFALTDTAQNRVAIWQDYVVAGSNTIKVINLLTRDQRELRTSSEDIRLVGAGGGIAFWIEDIAAGRLTLGAYPLTGTASDSITVDSGAIADAAISGDRLLYIKEGKLVSKRISEVLGER